MVETMTTMIHLCTSLAVFFLSRPSKMHSQPMGRNSRLSDAPCQRPKHSRLWMIRSNTIGTDSLLIQARGTIVSMTSFVRVPSQYRLTFWSRNFCYTRALFFSRLAKTRWLKTFSWIVLIPGTTMIPESLWNVLSSFARFLRKRATQTSNLRS